MNKTKTTPKQLFQIAVIAVIFTLSFLYSLRRNLPNGIYVDDEFFYLISGTLLESDEKNQISLKANDSEIDFTITLNGSVQKAKLKSEGSHVSIDYENGPSIDGEWSGERIINDEGMPLEFDLDEITVWTDGKSSKTNLRYSSLSNALYQISQNQLTKRNSIWTILLGISFYAIGALEFLYPNTYHFFLRGWRYKKAELSEEGAITEKIGGIIVMIIALVAITGIFIS